MKGKWLMSSLKTFKFTTKAYEDYLWLKEYEPQLAGKVKVLIENIMQTPFAGLGKPEPLKFDLSGCWSRRINQQHRLVYRIVNDEVQILACRYHYD